MRQEVFRIHNGTIRMDGKTILENISLSIFAGERIGLCGLGALERTCLAKAVSGIIPFDSGEIYIDEKTVRDYHLENAQKFGIFYVSSHSKLISALSIVDNVFSLVPEFPWKIVAQKENRDLLKGLLQELDIDIPIYGKINQLSSSQIYLLEMIKAALQGARIIFLDNVQVFFNSAIYQKLERIMQKFRDISFVYISDYNDENFRNVQRMVLLRNRHIAGFLYADEYSASKIFDMCGGRYPHQQNTAEQETAARPGKLLFELRSLEQQDAVMDIELYENEIVGIYVETEKDMMEIEKRLYGRKLYGVTVSGKKIRSFEKMIGAGVSVMTRKTLDHGMFHKLSVMDNVLMPVLPKVSKGPVISKKLEEFFYRECVSHNYTGLHAENERWANFVTLIYRMTVAKSQVFIFDQIPSCFDIDCKSDVLDIIMKFRSENTAVLLISTSLKECYNFCDRFYVPVKRRMYSREQISFEALYDLFCK